MSAAPLPEDPAFSTWAECFAAYQIPEHLREGLERYLVHRIRPGSFLCSVLDNDLREAVTRADPESLVALPRLAVLLYNEAPAPCLNRTAWEKTDGCA
jgi:hypothetical protein